MDYRSGGKPIAPLETHEKSGKQGEKLCGVSRSDEAGHTLFDSLLQTKQHTRYASATTKGYDFRPILERIMKREDFSLSVAFCNDTLAKQNRVLLKLERIHLPCTFRTKNLDARLNRE
jgi:hypothetical protein